MAHAGALLLLLSCKARCCSCSSHVPVAADIFVPHWLHNTSLPPASLRFVPQAIRAAPDGTAARAALTSRFGLSSAQAEAVLGMTLRRLTGLEAGKLQEEQQQLAGTIADLQVCLGDMAVTCFVRALVYAVCACKLELSLLVVGCQQCMLPLAAYRAPD
jgi:hypothetical protein